MERNTGCSTPSGSPAGNVLESPQCPRWHGVVLKVGGAGVIILLVMVAVLSASGGSGCKLCPTEWLLHRDKCYWLSNETKTWNESCDDCSRKGSQMLVIQDQEQMVELEIQGVGVAKD
ncbi:Killer cell lectin-like receptor subfamily B member 1B allele B [Chelonia mydas]|uniref:Killer cell lectin-like receptor subfamily B member 1B allele B n=1 Tax=Chelonia mydas TaxID=8469 RepID=M7AP64_CHEMY|nr:Killer cell lectin-like receptor subfamily B member 1B allele B [Chelonia mydas]